MFKTEIARAVGGLLSRVFGWLVGLLGVCCGVAVWAAPQDETIVIYNRNMPESEQLAHYYADRRNVPANQLFGFDLPATETLTRSQYQKNLEQPLLSALDSAKLFDYTKGTDSTQKRQPSQRVQHSRIRYAALCYGVPVRILPDADLVEEGEEEMRSELRRNEAAVDSELAMLPLSRLGYRLFGPLPNLLYGATNKNALSPTNGLLMVARLDGPSVSVARGLIDKAMEAETNGLWGRGYFDVRGLTNTSYKLGDDWIRGAASICRNLGFETVLDERPETIPSSYPMSHIAFYAGWYDAHVSGPFVLPKVEFMPGAIAYHLHSFSAHVLRSTNLHWAGPLLDRGATATLGCVYEPYLEMTPNITILFDRFFRGYTFGEAAYASQRLLSWQTTIIGDPIYCPFGQPPQVVHESLIQRGTSLVEWSFLRILNRYAVLGAKIPDQIRSLEGLPLAQKSAVLQEKLGDIYLSQTNLNNAILCYGKALKFSLSRQQSIRLSLELARLYESQGGPEESYKLLKDFARNFSDFPGMTAIYQKLRDMAQKLNKAEDAEAYQRKIELRTQVSEAISKNGN